MKRLVYLVGPPGVGKSTLMAALTEGCRRESQMQPFAHDWLYRPGGQAPVAVELGRRRDDFPGTDALSMSVSGKVEHWLADQKPEFVLGEGARLATYRFLSFARVAHYRITLFHLSASEGDLGCRRRGRGSTQSESWMRGAETRAKNILDKMALDADIHRVDASVPVPELLQQVLTLEPALKVLTDD